MIEALRALVVSPLTFAAVVTLAGVAVVLIAWYRDRPRQTAAAPELDLLPAPADLRRVDFPLAVAGYHPTRVELHIEALARAYETLYEVAPPEVRAEARRAAARRRGVELTDVAVSAPAARPPRSVVAGPDVDALRTEAALAEFERPAGRGSRTGKRSPSGQ